MLKKDKYKVIILLTYLIGLFLFVSLHYIGIFVTDDILINRVYYNNTGFKEESFQKMYDEFGEENVAFYKNGYSIGDINAELVFTTNNFVEVGTFGTNLDTNVYGVREVKLIKGEVWDNKNSTEVVIDEFGAEYFFNSVDNAIGKEITMGAYTVTVSGVVTDDIERISNKTELYPKIYMPYRYSETNISHYDHGVGYIIKTKPFQVQSTRNDVYDLFNLDKGSNPYFVQTYWHVISTYATPINQLIAAFTAVFVALSVPVILILRNRHQNRIQVITYDDTYKSKVAALNLKDHQISFVKSPKEIVDYHLFGDDDTLLYMAIKKETVVGLCCIKKNTDNNNYFIRYLLIGKQFQGNHYGKKFIKNILKVIPKGTWVTTTTKEDNIVATSFFEDLKFNEFSREAQEINLEYGSK